MKRKRNVFLRALFFFGSVDRLRCTVNEEEILRETRIAHTTYYTGQIFCFYFFLFCISNSCSSIVLLWSYIQHKTAVCSKHNTQLTTTKSDYRYTHMLRREREPKQITVLKPAQTVCSFVLMRTERFFFRSLAHFARFEYDNDDKNKYRLNRKSSCVRKKRAILFAFL